MKKAAVSKPKTGVKAGAVKPVKSLVAKPKTVTARKPSATKTVQATGQVLSELKQLARELNQAAKGLGKRSASTHPKEVSSILVNVERMTAEAATKSLVEAESAKQLVNEALASLGKDWNRRELDNALKGVGNHLTNIIVAQEFQDLAGQALRKAVKALVGAIIVVEGGGSTEEQRLSQLDVDSLLKDLMP
ncbi:MAG: hypothetical protein Q8J67_00225 [Rhodocyclaceae bacterium]|jgi:chemotaxis regulatin CheY-phosphate phosphatase CheZ|nr:hypothetical protein [Rhodocyclaceae bacterium]MDP2194496.1 hypothetical protein [Rhodocyclaceae bacterium]MDP3037210.1 hypothetical protein [Rhodocyclaceae bacterium]